MTGYSYEEFDPGADYECSTELSVEEILAAISRLDSIQLSLRRAGSDSHQATTHPFSPRSLRYESDNLAVADGEILSQIASPHRVRVEVSGEGRAAAVISHAQLSPTVVRFWIEENLQPRSISSPRLLLGLLEFGIELTFSASTVELRHGGYAVSVPLRGWASVFEELTAAGPVNTGPKLTP